MLNAEARELRCWKCKGLLDANEVRKNRILRYSREIYNNVTYSIKCPICGRWSL